MYSNLLPGEPALMPWQSKPFNNDHFICEEFLKIKEKFKIKTVVELGSCVMGTAKWLGENFDQVITVEVNSEFRNFGLERVSGMANVISILGDSVKELPGILNQCSGQTIVWIDSHWGNHFPLFDELKIIAESKVKPVIVIHDCLVPERPDLGFDSYNGVDISFDSVKEYLNEIYDNKYIYYYNNGAAGAKRGCLFVTPLQ